MEREMEGEINGGGGRKRERDPFRQRRRFEYGTILLLAFLLPHSAGTRVTVR